MEMANNIGVLPPNADKLLFAEDLLSSVVYYFNNTFYPTWRAGPYRELIYNGFNQEVKAAVEFLCESLQWEVARELAHMVQNAVINKDALLSYARNYEFLYFNEGFEPIFFLTYCVRVASLAAYFAQNNITEALDIALFQMCKVFQNYDMFDGGWEALNTAARMLAKKSKDSQNLLTPDSSEVDSMSTTSDVSLSDVEEDTEMNDNHVIGKENDFVLEEEESQDEENEEILQGIADEILNSTISKVNSKSFKEIRSSDKDKTVDDAKVNTVREVHAPSVDMYRPEALTLDKAALFQYQVKIIKIFNGSPTKENHS